MNSFLPASDSDPFSLAIRLSARTAMRSHSRMTQVREHIERPSWHKTAQKFLVFWSWPWASWSLWSGPEAGTETASDKRVGVRWASLHGLCCERNGAWKSMEGVTSVSNLDYAFESNHSLGSVLMCLFLLLGLNCWNLADPSFVAGKPGTGPSLWPLWRCVRGETVGAMELEFSQIRSGDHWWGGAAMCFLSMDIVGNVSKQTLIPWHMEDPSRDIAWHGQ